MTRGGAGGTASGQQDDGYDVGNALQAHDILGQGRPSKAGVFTSLPTRLCDGGYVSGTILHLKQGSDPHPQGPGSKG